MYNLLDIAWHRALHLVMLIIYERWFCRIGVKLSFAWFTLANIYPYFRCYIGKESKTHSGKLNACPITASRLTPPIAHGTVATSRWTSYCKSHKFQRPLKFVTFAIRRPSWCGDSAVCDRRCQSGCSDRASVQLAWVCFAFLADITAKIWVDIGKGKSRKT